jgi:hypothetical protein
MALLLLSPWYIYFTKLNNNRIDYTLFGTSKQSGSRGVASYGFIRMLVAKSTDAPFREKLNFDFSVHRKSAFFPVT